ncbi:hypothetical protein IAF52_09375 [Acinetobacter baumannii]|jgi:hypothetical protein|uniref:DUF2570 domain-containing protein n=1 Tax=Acinetobacter baumannii TaxID=470 RepID=A0A5P1ULS1_ACIBA|nr:hypothetical protein [Acinetobacter baumannii]ABS90130.2 hypothetical protein A1S_3705 [Acinetobacter baumannii ATCC 17978]AKQ27045.1 hypothetical protein ACX60_09950 [Acinetobacter baumannii]APP32197.1 hypothetical protein AUO97_15715 [Acinetobacter baumannii]APX50664.1 hypothetical protein AT570_15710 [Acinetobacter baumannii]EKU2731497.1 hypothetical protein [Acinetobacter baumannii]
MTWILNNKRWSLIIVLSVLYLIQIGYTNHLAGKINQADQKCLSQIQKIEKKNLEALAEKQNQINKVSADYEKVKAEQNTKVEYIEREVQKIVERPVYKSSCIDDDGVQQLNELIKAGNTS